jgi:hypothetical protein
LARATRLTLGGRGDTLLAKNYFGFLDVALGFIESLLAIHHSGAGFFPELLY